MEQTEALMGKHLDELKVGDQATHTQQVEEQHVLLYMGAAGDLNPLYTDKHYAGRTRYERPIVPVNLVAAFVGGTVSRVLPGRGSVTVAHRYRMVVPAHIGDDLTAHLEVTGIRPKEGEVVLSSRVTNQTGSVILEGELIVQPPPRLLPIMNHMYENF
ncbi:MAG: FAS1-like dehydratase domain-containing protein [Symbiobacteriia bacterium]